MENCYSCWSRSLITQSCFSNLSNFPRASGNSSVYLTSQKLSSTFRKINCTEFHSFACFQPLHSVESLCHVLSFLINKKVIFENFFIWKKKKKIVRGSWFINPQNVWNLPPDSRVWLEKCEIYCIHLWFLELYGWIQPTSLREKTFFPEIPSGKDRTNNPFTSTCWWLIFRGLKEIKMSQAFNLMARRCNINHTVIRSDLIPFQQNKQKLKIIIEEDRRRWRRFLFSVIAGMA